MTYADRTTVPKVADDLVEMLALEQIEQDIYRANFVVPEDRPLYGGLVAAQALAAAGGTVPAERLAHSLHGYFLRPGDSHRPTVFRVERDRDGGAFSARRVIAVQRGEVIFNMAASFHRQRAGAAAQLIEMPVIPPPDELAPYAFKRQPAFEVRATLEPGSTRLPTRFWARCRQFLPDDPLTHACVLTYLSDASTGLVDYLTMSRRPAASVDHALWLHRTVRLDEWLLVDLVGHVVAQSRGLYSGSVFTSDGTLAATITQEMLFRG